MADYDPSSIPILDDIISTGDTEKAASRSQSDLLKSLEPQQDETLDSVNENSQATPEPQKEPEPEIATWPSLEDTQVEDENLSASESAEITHESEPASNTNGLSVESTEQPPIAIDTLTEDILASVMPEMERLLRDRIRQALEQQLHNDDSQATDTSPSS